MDKKLYFHFSLGPVQEFVGKARRLRDYWTGSYLLSYLTEQGLKEVNNQKGQMVFPAYKENNWRGRAVEPNFMVGSFPNRFQAIVSEDFNPIAVINKIEAAWQEIAEYIWVNFISQTASSGRNSREIWQRQIKGFWHLQWVLDAEENDALLDIRKNWRSRVPTVEPGDKCTLFGNLQEISGYIRSMGSKERKEQDDFWEKMRTNLASLDLKEGERLSAIALIKRLFPKAHNYFSQGPKLPENFPSTTYMSAIMWKKSVMEREKRLAVDFTKEARKLKIGAAEAKAGIRELEELAGDDKDLQDFIALDGNCFYPHILLNDNLWENEDRKQREHLAKKLKVINDKIGLEPDTYYALLSMDGDRIGAVIQDHGCKKKEISGAISAFSREVPKIITAYNGRVVYAGGEDVFAILPVDTAVKAAIELKDRYEKLFEEVFDGKKIATISAAVIFVHHNAPLNQAYFEIQALLDNKAKDEYGRASLAVGVWGTGGLDLVWAMPWAKFLVGGQDNLIDEFAKAVGRGRSGAGVSTSFLYNMRKNEGLFLDDSLLSREEALDLLTAEFIKGSVEEENAYLPDKIRSNMKMLLELCSIYHRDREGRIKKQPGLNFDGALLAKFMAGRQLS